MGRGTWVLAAILSSCVAHEAETPATLARWFQQLNWELLHMNHATATLAWRLSTEDSNEAAQLSQRLGQVRTSWKNAWCANTRAVETRHGRLPSPYDRMAYLLCRGPKFTPHQSAELSAILGRLQHVYQAARVCGGVGGKCLRGEPDLERLMESSRVPEELLWAWQQWRRAVGPPSRTLYSALVALLNQGARSNGYRDVGECWREELESGHLQTLVERLYRRVEPLYRLLHAVVRYRLAQHYGERIVALDRPIPAHLLGNMWAQNWHSLLDLVLPDARLALTAALRRKHYSSRDMVRRAEDMYTSLGLDAMTPQFWAASQIDKPAENASCHGSAANMYRPDDYRMLLCAEVSEEDFSIIHHEMGHIEYYMAYKDQPTIFQDGANSAVQESIGDAIMYGVMTPQHLERLGITNDSSQTNDLTLLLHQALSKIPELPFAIMVDKWRWSTFEGQVSTEDYNDQWWAMRRKYQGVEPPVHRAKDDFDPLAKFHIADNTPYIRYFLSGILQVQMFKAMCQTAVFENHYTEQLPMPLHRCDIYGSKDVGRKLRAMMSQGSRRPWFESLKLLTGVHGVIVGGMLGCHTQGYGINSNKDLWDFFMRGKSAEHTRTDFCLTMGTWAAQ